MLPITNLGLTRPKIYTASRNHPTLKDHAGCVAAVEAWLRKFDKDIENKPDFFTSTCSPLAEVWLGRLRAADEARLGPVAIAPLRLPSSTKRASPTRLKRIEAGANNIRNHGGDDGSRL